MMARLACWNLRTRGSRQCITSLFRFVIIPIQVFHYIILSWCHFAFVIRACVVNVQ